MTRFCLAHKKITLVFWSLVISFFLVTIATRLLSDQPAIDNSVGIWFSTDDQALKDYQQYNQDFGEKEWTILLIKTASIYNPVFLYELNNITEKIEQLDHIVKATSIVNVRDNEIDQDDALNYTKVFPDVIDKQTLLTSKQLDQFKQKILANPLFEKNIFQKNDPQHTVILIQNDNQIWNASPYRIELVDAIKNIIQQHPSVDYFALAGTTVVNAELNRAAKRDVLIFYTLITLFLVIFGWLTLNSIKDLSIMLVVVCCSMASAMGLLAFLNIPYNMVTVMMPTILISLSVAGVIHIINEFHRLNQTYNASKAIQMTIQHLWRPHFSTSLTTIVGFVSLTLSTVVPIFQLGVFAGIGIFIGWLASLTIAPVLLVLFWQKKTKPINTRSILLDKWVTGLASIAPKYTAYKIFLLFLTLIPASGIFLLETDTNYTKFFKGSTDITQAYDNIDKTGYAQNPISIVLRFPEQSTWSDEAYFKHIVDFEQALGKLPKVIKLMSSTKLIEQVDSAFNSTNTSKAIFQGYNQNQINQLLLLGELSNNDDIDDFLLSSKRQAQIVALTPYMSSLELESFKKQVYDLQKQILPSQIELVITGTTVLWANMDKQVSHTQLVSLIGIASFLVVFLMVLFRSFKLGLIGILVNALPLAITLGVMGWLDIKINMATAIIGGISLGIVVDDSIHFLSGIRSRLNQGILLEDAINQTMKTVGSSILMTSVILIGGFSCMATSEFLPSAHFGIFISLAIAIAFLLDVIIVPALLLILKPSASKARKV